MANAIMKLRTRIAPISNSTVCGPRREAPRNEDPFTLPDVIETGWHFVPPSGPEKSHKAQACLVFAKEMLGATEMVHPPQISYIIK